MAEMSKSNVGEPRVPVPLLVLPLGAPPLAAVGAGGSGATAQDFAGYTEDQARAGQLVYESVCASCHMSNLQGDFDAPELAGPNFLNTCFTQNSKFYFFFNLFFT